MSESECCIAGCIHFGTHFHEGRFYCIEHWGEAVGEPPVDYRASTIVPFKCCVKDCNNAGVSTEIGTQNHYCISHAWKVDRPDEAGLQHPKQAHWTPEDAVRAHGKGLSISEKDLPIVSESVAELCKRELEEGKKKGWKTR